MTKQIHVGFETEDFRPGPHKLAIENPGAQADLVTAVPKGVQPVSYLNCYDTPELVHCAFCASHQLHQKGFTVEMADGTIALCGRICAKEFFGQQLDRKLSRDLKDRIAKAHRREMAARTFRGLDDLPQFGTDLEAAERQGRELLDLVSEVFPAHAFATLRAGGVPRVAEAVLSSTPTLPLTQEIQGIITQMKNVRARRTEISDTVLGRVLTARLRLTGLINELGVFFDHLNRFMAEQSLWAMAEYHASLPPNGTCISVAKGRRGPEIHIFRAGFGVIRFPISLVAEFDASGVIALINQRDD